MVVDLDVDRGAAQRVQHAVAVTPRVVAAFSGRCLGARRRVRRPSSSSPRAASAPSRSRCAASAASAAPAAAACSASHRCCAAARDGVAAGHVRRAVRGAAGDAVLLPLLRAVAVSVAPSRLQQVDPGSAADFTCMSPACATAPTAPRRAGRRAEWRGGGGLARRRAGYVAWADRAGARARAAGREGRLCILWRLFASEAPRRFFPACKS